jgi:hypothetical protein
VAVVRICRREEIIHLLPRLRVRVLLGPARDGTRKIA